MDIMSMIHNFHIFYLNVHVCFLFCNLQFASFYSSLVSLFYSMVWSMASYFADLICLNLSDSANGSKEQLQSFEKLLSVKFSCWFLPQKQFWFFPAFLICCLWEASYPTTNLVSQTNFKVLKNSQNLDLLGLKQLLRIHLLCSQNLRWILHRTTKGLIKSFNPTLIFLKILLLDFLWIITIDK